MNRWSKFMGFICRIFKRLALDKECRDSWAILGQKAFFKQQKEDLALEELDADTSDISLGWLFISAKSIEELFEIIADEKYPFDTRKKVSLMILSCFGEECPERYHHLKVSRLSLQYLLNSYFILIRYMPTMEKEIRVSARKVLCDDDYYEFFPS